MNDTAWMDRALQLADLARGNTAPNPAVGAVLVRDGEILGEGYTRPVGGPHAEREALRDCQERGHDPRGATLYVTLEPCRHHGRTPPCSEAIREAGLARVVVGILDPFPEMRGRSAEELRAAGIDVTLGVREGACARRILGFARAIMVGLPEITCKAGITADGHLATAAGESRWITGAAAREDAHLLRARHDAVLVGIGTALADDPRLTVRLPETSRLPPRAQPPVPVVLDTALRLPAGARLLQHPRALVICALDAPERQVAAEIVRVPRSPSGVDLQAALKAMVERDLHRVLVEGGARLHRALLDEGLVDTVELYVAGKIVPGGRPWVGGPPIESLDQHIAMELQAIQRFGSDARLTYHLEHAIAPDPLAALRSRPSMR